MKLTDEQVHMIRTAGYTDSYLARRLRVHHHTIRLTRIGALRKDHPTPPDLAPRDCGGKHSPPKAIPARQRWSYYRE